VKLLFKAFEKSQHLLTKFITRYNMPDEKKKEGSGTPGRDFPDVVVGRLPGDTEKYGTKGTILLGSQYHEVDDKMVLKNKVYMDVSGAHVLFICGKRGGGKSYTMGVIAEGFELLEEDVKENLSIILLDTMGVYWTMTHANKKEADLLRPFNIKPKPVKIRIFTPEKFYYEYKKKGIPSDVAFTMDPSELEQEDWCKAFKQGKYEPVGILIGETLEALKKQNSKFSVDDILEYIRNNKEAEKNVRDATLSMFKMAKGWGLFSDKATPISELAKGGQIAVLDVSCYATMPGGWDVKALVVGIVSRHLFIQRMEFRKGEEFASIKYLESFYGKTGKHALKQDMPLVWLVVDEAHEFLPKEGENAATEPLIIIMREGRQPGICLVVATQQPGKIHTDVMTQSDMVLSHRITAAVDTDALGLLAQSYQREGLMRAMNWLPRVKGTAVLFDDANEKILQIRVRPRMTWHGGASPTAVKDTE